MKQKNNSKLNSNALPVLILTLGLFSTALCEAFITTPGMRHSVLGVLLFPAVGSVFVCLTIRAMQARMQMAAQ